MKIGQKIHFIFPLLLLGLVVLLLGCANRGSGPQGGPKDVLPPQLLSSKPENKAKNIDKKRFILHFDENVTLEKPSEKIVVSPPQKTPATIQALGDKIAIELEDSLRPNETYTIDFSDAIRDNNEKNILENFSYAFSTGEVLDSMAISGYVLEASTLNPMSGIMVGIHSDLSDTAFTSKAFDRITRTDVEGFFSVKNMKPGTYSVFALKDMANNYFYDIPTEMVGFIDTTVTTTQKQVMRTDTIWRPKTSKEYEEIDFSDPDHASRFDSARAHLEVDTIITHMVSEYYPNNLLIRSFVLPSDRHYITEKKRKTEQTFTFYFNTPQDSLPIFKGLNFDLDRQARPQFSAKGDTMTYWLTDSAAWQLDTLLVSVSYQKTDTANMLRWQTDTIPLRFRHVTKKDDKKKGGFFSNLGRKDDEDLQPKTVFLKAKLNASSKFEVYNPFVISFTEPTLMDSSAHFSLMQKVDTVLDTLQATWHPMDSLGFQYAVDYDWRPGEKYVVRVDSASFHNYYGHPNNTINANLTVKKLEEYSKLTLTLTPNTGNEIVQLLDSKDKVVRSSPVDIKGEVEFQYVKPGVYYARVIIDANRNGVWDTGNYSTKLQPEQVYYFPYTLKLLAFWAVNEKWNYLKEPVLEQKPLELVDAASGKKSSKK